MKFRLNRDFPLNHNERRALILLGRALDLSGHATFVREFSDGLSPTKVGLLELQDECPNRQFVYKIGSASTIRREINGLKGFQPPEQSLFIPLYKHEETLGSIQNVSDIELGALLYVYAGEWGAATTVKSLTKFCCEYIQGTQDFPEEPLAKIFNTLQKIKTSSSSGDKSLQEYYNDRWFPHYDINVIRSLKMNGNILLTASNDEQLSYQNAIKSSPEELSRRAHTSNNSKICQKGLSVLEAWESKIKVSDAAHPTLRIHINGAELLPDEKTAVCNVEEGRLCILAEPSNSRFERYHDRLRDCLEKDGIQLDRISIGNRSLVNPFPKLEEHLQEIVNTSQAQEYECCPAHGDLHPGNVLLAGSQPIIIDYGLATDSAPVGVDATRLIGGLFRDICAFELDFAELEQLFEHLFFSATTPNKSAQLCRATKLMEYLFKRGTDYFDSNRELLFAHLFGYSWIGLKWTGGHQSHYTCFLLASYTLTSVLKKPVEGAQGAISPKSLPRDSEVCARICSLLLDKGLTLVELLSQLSDFSEEHIQREVSHLKQDGIIQQTATELTLVRSEDTAIRLFLLLDTDPESQCTLILSDYFRTIMGSEEIANHLRPFILDQGKRKRATRLLQHSPSGLRTLFSDPPGYEEYGASGDSIAVTEIETSAKRDLSRFPLLISLPDWLEYVFETQSESEEFKELRIKRMMWYLRGLDRRRVLEQWVYLNDDEAKIWQLPEKSSEFKISLKSRTNDLDFLELDMRLAAGRRLNEPVRLVSGKTRIIASTLADSETKGTVLEAIDSDVDTTIIEFGTNTSGGMFSLPGFLESKGTKISVVANHPSSAERWKLSSFALTFYPFSGGKKIHITISPQRELSCQQSWLYRKALSQESIDLHVTANTGSGALCRIALPEFETLETLSDEDEKILSFLARLEEATGERIPFPSLIGDKYILPEIPNSILDEAQLNLSPTKVLDDLRKFSQERVRETRSPVYLITEYGEETLEYHCLRVLHGARLPRWELNTVSEFSTLRENNEQTLAIEFTIRNSARAAITAIKEGGLPVILEMRAQGPEDLSTRVQLRWEKKRTSFWYDSTPFVVSLTPVSVAERWRHEASYLSSKGEQHRAWIAGREYLRNSAEDLVDPLITLSWMAFELGMYEKARTLGESALETLKKHPNKCDAKSKYIAYSNLGLYALVLDQPGAPDAIALYEKALTVSEETEDEHSRLEGYAVTAREIGRIKCSDVKKQGDREEGDREEEDREEEDREEEDCEEEDCEEEDCEEEDCEEDCEEEDREEEDREEEGCREEEDCEEEDREEEGCEEEDREEDREEEDCEEEDREEEDCEEEDRSDNCLVNHHEHPSWSWGGNAAHAKNTVSPASSMLWYAREPVGCFWKPRWRITLNRYSGNNRRWVSVRSQP